MNKTNADHINSEKDTDGAGEWKHFELYKTWLFVKQPLAVFVQQLQANVLNIRIGTRPFEKSK